MTTNEDRLAEALRSIELVLRTNASDTEIQLRAVCIAQSAAIREILAEYEKTLAANPAPAADHADYVLVPKVPTEAMIEAAEIREDDEPLSDWGKTASAPHEAIYVAMIAAATAPQTAPADDDEIDDERSCAGASPERQLGFNAAMKIGDQREAEAKRATDRVRKAFQNFHRSLCERVGYTHDPVDWSRDLVSLEEHIANLVSDNRPQPAPAPVRVDEICLHALPFDVHSPAPAADGAGELPLYDDRFWQNGIAGDANIVTFNGEDIVGVARIHDDGLRAHIIRKQNQSMRAAIAALRQPAAVWRCSQCGELLDEMNPSWRWTGDRWQHHHANVGHVDARSFGSPSQTAPDAEVRRRLDVFYAAYLAEARCHTGLIDSIAQKAMRAALESAIASQQESRND